VNLPVHIPIPRLDAVAKAIDAENANAKAPAKSVTTAIGGVTTAKPKEPRAVVEPSPTTSAVPTTTVATFGSTVQAFSPSELRAFAKAEEKAQQACLELYAQETSQANGKTKISMVVIGHVDAGKSTITGHLLYKLGYVSQRQMHKFEKESREAGKASFAYAWVMDADDDERSRGVTMDVGTSFFETASKHVTLLDAPGHRDFIPKMIAGASQADVAVLVVPAATGEFEAAFEHSGQTKEHTLLVRSLGVTQLVVAVNKMDATGWSQARFDAIVASLTPFLHKSGFRPKNLWFVPVSGMTGANLHVKLDPKDCPWYNNGPTLLEAIDKFSPPPREIAKPFRMTVSDVSKSMSLGQTISGRVYAGAAAIGDTLLLMPLGQTLTIKGLEQNGKQIPYVRSGDTVDVGVTGIDASALSTGSILCSIVSPVRLVRKFEAKIMTMPAVEVPLVKGSRMTIHVHHVDEPVNITRLVSILSKTGEIEKRKPRCLTREKSAVVQITCVRPICLETFTAYRQLGRFTLRDRGATLAAGIITEILK
jgi:elongation factor 1 alpha-like protein